MTYHATAPSPHPRSTYMHTGRGGLGNTVRVPSPDSTKRLSTSSTAASSSAPNSSILPPSTHRFTTGRGGAGNVHSAAEQRAMFSFDEEIERQRAREQHAAPVIHVGRGGAGNTASSIRGDGESARDRKSWESSGSEGSDKAGWKRLSRLSNRS